MCTSLLPLFLLHGFQIPKRLVGSPGGLPGGRAPRPRPEGREGVSQLDERRRKLQVGQIACAKAKGGRASGDGDISVPSGGGGTVNGERRGRSLLDVTCEERLPGYPSPQGPPSPPSRSSPCSALRVTSVPLNFCLAPLLHPCPEKTRM